MRSGPFSSSFSDDCESSPTRMSVGGTCNSASVRSMSRWRKLCSSAQYEQAKRLAVVVVRDTSRFQLKWIPTPPDLH